MPVKISPRSQERGPDGRADLAVAIAQRGFVGPGADVHVGARLAGGGHAVHGADRLSLHQDDALVAGTDRRQIGLGDDRLAKEGAEHLDQRVEVLVRRSHVEHARAAVAEERLEDDVAMPGAEVDDHVALGGDQRRRHQLREPRDEEFLGRVPHVDGVVDHEGPGWMCSRMWVAVM